jgi:hypothetical protein
MQYKERNMSSARHMLQARFHAAGQRGGQQLRRHGIRIALILLVAVPAFAQYGGTTGASGGSTPSYGSGKAIGIGVGAAAAGAGAIYFMTHRSSHITGCVAMGDGGLVLTDDKTKRSFDLLTGDADIKAGERVELKGKIKKAESGDATFNVKSVSKNLGECNAQASATPKAPMGSQMK